MSYYETQCITLEVFKRQVKDGLFGEMKEIKDVKLYQNDKKQWRLRCVVFDRAQNQERSINVLASTFGKKIYINSKSLDFIVNKNKKEEDDWTKLAEFELY